MTEEDIEKTTLRTGSSGLYKFTHMPFGLSNAGSSFCRLMAQCLGDQQFVTLLLYLDDICIFTPSGVLSLPHKTPPNSHYSPNSPTPHLSGTIFGK